MQGLLQAINNLFQGNAALQAIFPGYNNADATPACTCNFWWADELPENAPFPYCVGSVVVGNTEALYGGLNNYGASDNTIRFTIYGSTLNTVMTAAEAMCNVFNSVLPTMPSGQSLTNVYQKSDVTPAFEGKDKIVGNVFRADVLYDYAPATP